MCIRDSNDGEELPFAWLTWNNRPFANALELANVPFTSSYFLTNRFDVSQRQLPNVDWNVYANAELEDDPFRRTGFSGEFPHLLNFHSDVVNGPQLQKVFDHLCVPSRYLGTEEFLNPATFATGGAGDETNFTRGFSAPFDFVSNYREPGKINVNTITDFRVWDSLMSTYSLNVGDNGEQFIAWTGQVANNPLRPTSAANLVPQTPGNLIPTPSPANAGLYRRAFNPSTGVFDDDVPLLDFQGSDTTDPAGHSNRSAYFRNHQRQRLGNMITNRSSMFAIWITVGYFEVETVTAVDENGNDVSIDVLGREFTDEIEGSTRNRAFFIFDRSIPVAFEPGQNHDVQKAIRVSSFIE